MNRKNYILGFLTLAYFLVLAHAFIPHHHHESLSEVTHQHDHGEDHQHPESSDDNKAEKLPISHLHHEGSEQAEAYIRHSSTNSFTTIKSCVLLACLAFNNFYFRDVPKPVHPEFLGLLVLSDHFQTSFTLRGPPVSV